MEPPTAFPDILGPSRHLDTPQPLLHQEKSISSFETPTVSWKGINLFTSYSSAYFFPLNFLRLAYMYCPSCMSHNFCRSAIQLTSDNFIWRRSAIQLTSDNFIWRCSAIQLTSHNFIWRLLVFYLLIVGLIFDDSSKTHILLLFVLYLIKLASRFLHQILDFAPAPTHLVS